MKPKHTWDPNKSNIFNHFSHHFPGITASFRSLLPLFTGPPVLWHRVAADHLQRWQGDPLLASLHQSCHGSLARDKDPLGQAHGQVVTKRSERKGRCGKVTPMQKLKSCLERSFEAEQFFWSSIPSSSMFHIPSKVLEQKKGLIIFYRQKVWCKLSKS